MIEVSTRIPSSRSIRAEFFGSFRSVVREGIALQKDCILQQDTIAAAETNRNFGSSSQAARARLSRYGPVSFRSDLE